MTPDGPAAWLRAARRSAIEHRPTAGERWTALLAGVVGVAGSFAYGGPTTDFVAVPVTDAVIALTPGLLTAVSIQLLGRLSEALVLATALDLAVAAVGLGTLVGLPDGPAVAIGPDAPRRSHPGVLARQGPRPDHAGQ